MKNIRQRILGFILMGIGLVLIAVGVYEIAQTDEFKSAARIKLVVPDCSCITEEGSNHEDHHPEFFQAETKAILSDSILSNVVYRLELREKWAKKFFNREPELRMERNQRVLETGKIKTAEAVKLMRERLEVIRVPNTTLADVVFVSDDADEAAMIANMVAEVYRDWRIVLRQRLAGGGVAALKRQLEIEDGKIKKAKEDLDRLQRELNIPDAEVESRNSKTNFPTYWDAMRKFEQLNDFWNLISRKMNIEDVDLRLPYHPPEIIIESAIPAKTPVRHHRRRGAIFICVGLVLLGCSVVVHRKSNRALP